MIWCVTVLLFHYVTDMIRHPEYINVSHLLSAYSNLGTPQLVIYITGLYTKIFGKSFKLEELLPINWLLSLYSLFVISIC